MVLELKLTEINFFTFSKSCEAEAKFCTTINNLISWVTRDSTGNKHCSRIDFTEISFSLLSPVSLSREYKCRDNVWEWKKSP